MPNDTVIPRVPFIYPCCKIAESAFFIIHPCIKCLHPSKDKQTKLYKSKNINTRKYNDVREIVKCN